MPDIDIDFADRDKILQHLKYISASSQDGDSFKKHNTGIYCTDIPHDPFTNLSTVDYKQAEQRNYFKIDFLNVTLYKDVINEQHLIKLMNTEPLWELLEQDDFTDLLFHVNGYGDILRTMKPRTVEQLAAVLAIIRPAKRYLLGQDWKTVLTEIWQKPSNDEYYFKKSHAIAYAVAVIVQMNLICESVSYEFT